MGFVCLCLSAVSVEQIFETRLKVLHEALRETQNLARSLALHADGTISTADAVLIGLRDRVATDGTGAKALDQLKMQMRVQAEADPSLHGLFVIDENGRWLANTSAGTSPDVNYADRDFFIHARDHLDNAPFIGAPVRSRTDGSWLLTISRRLSHPDGSFAGVVLASISMDLFQQFYGRFDVGPHGSIALANDDGVLIVRHPYEEANIGLDISHGGFFSTANVMDQAGSVEFKSVLDREVRMASFERVKRYHVVVVVTHQKDDVLAAWRGRSQAALTLLCLVIVLVTALGYHLCSQVDERSKAEAQYRLLAENASDAIICVNSEGERSYVSPSFSAMTGWTPAELAGMRRHDMVFTDDQAAIDDVLGGLDAGDASPTCRYRHFTKGRGLIWVEMRARAAAAKRDGVLDYILNIRDISTQKLAEEELAEANAELSAMTLSDALTGISNRRNFDQTLRREWRRAMRNARPLALLMIDADHFKAYNDRYGHVLGDECLKLIAQLLAAGVRRAGDVVARYGGEEFAAILPDLTAEKAAIVAERMRMSLVEAAIAHDGNTDGIVTVSIGVASLVPGRGLEPRELIALADEALYRAKEDGRNRVVVVEPIREVRTMLAAG